MRVLSFIPYNLEILSIGKKKTTNKKTNKKTSRGTSFNPVEKALIKYI